jgi:hypothetical protein
MPFIVDLPPIDFPDENTKIERVDLNGQKNSGEFDFETLNIDKDLFENVYFKEKFNSLLYSWKNKTIFQSSISKIIEDKNFTEILKMNKKELFPLIIDEIEKEPSVLVWALNIISGQSLEIKQRHTIEDVCKKWVSLYRQGKINIV